MKDEDLLIGALLVGGIYVLYKHNQSAAGSTGLSTTVVHPVTTAPGGSGSASVVNPISTIVSTIVKAISPSQPSVPISVEVPTTQQQITASSASDSDLTASGTPSWAAPPVLTATTVPGYTPVAPIDIQSGDVLSIDDTDLAAKESYDSEVYNMYENGIE